MRYITGYTFAFLAVCCYVFNASVFIKSIYSKDGKGLSMVPFGPTVLISLSAIVLPENPALICTSCVLVLTDPGGLGHLALVLAYRSLCGPAGIQRQSKSDKTGD
jgi:hypothetical protein